MNKHTKYIIAALAVAVVVSNIMISSKARSVPTVAPRLGVDSIPADVRELRTRADAAAEEYSKAIKPFDAQLDDLADDRLSAEESAKLLAEVDKATGEQERAMNELRKQLNTRMAELVRNHTNTK